MSHDVLVAGETLIDFLPERAGPLTDVVGFVRRPGGAPANVAVGLAKLGVDPLFWTRVGTDPFGDFLVSTLERYGVSTRFVERDRDAKTTVAFVTHDEAGERSFTFYRENTADTRLDATSITDATLQGLEWVHVGGVTLSRGPSREATIDLVERACDAGCTVSFDPNYRPELWPSTTAFAEVAGDVLEVTDVVAASVDELRALCVEGGDARTLARETLERGPHTVFVTRGGEGALAVAADRSPRRTETADRSREAEHEGYPVEVVDTTGAGDAFTAGAIATMLDGATLAETLAVANAVAAAATTARGAMTALPDRDAVATIRE